MKRSAYHAIGTYARDGQWHTATFIAKAFWAYDYNGAGHTWGMNELFEFNSGVYVSEVSVGVMEKYAILIGGGDTDASKNYDAFKNDLFEMYDTLKSYDGWKDGNIYCYLWDKTTAYDWRVDGTATEGNIGYALWQIRASITEDDFFYFFEVSHGGTINGGDYDGEGYFVTYFKDQDVGTPFSRLGQDIGLALQNRWARSLFVFASCYSGHGISEIHNNGKIENSIVVSSTRANELSYAWYDNSLDPTADDHEEFLHNDKSNGFILSLKNGKTNILSAYYSGYDAAGDKDHYSKGISHPLLDDNSDGIGHEKGCMDGDGNLASFTYL